MDILLLTKTFCFMKESDDNLTPEELKAEIERRKKEDEENL